MAYGLNEHGQYPWDGFLSSPKTDAGLVERIDLRGRRVLITGAGGYLGSAVAGALVDAGATSLCLLDIVEHGLHRLEVELDRRRFSGETVFVIGDVKDQALLGEMFSRCRPEIVIHTAALKHVPMMQTNSIAAASTNILGTAAVLSAAAHFEVERCVLVSSDKAVDAVGIMGATKRVAEVITLAAEKSARASVARLCNVLGSTGSVAPLFAEQIARGDRVSVTDRAATRFFITRAEAAHCILHAGCAASSTRMAVPRRAERRTIVELAQYLLEAAGQATSRICFTQLRAGERLHETLWSGDEFALAPGPGSPLQPLSVPAETPEVTERVLGEIERAVERRDRAALAEAMAALVPSAFEVHA